MKKLLMASTAAVCFASGAFAAGHEVNVGVILGFTGPLESITPDMAAGAEMAFAEVNAAGGAAGKTIVPVRADSTCVDAAAATTAATRLIDSDNVAAIMGADCSGVTTAIANSVAVPKGVVMISPSATSPALSSIEDNDLFFRVAPSDARQGDVLAGILIERGIASVAVTYTNNDYGKGLSDSFASAYLAAGGAITINAAHEDGKGDYSAEVGALSSAGGAALVVLGYVDQGGAGIMRNSIDTAAFDIYVMGDGMYGQALLDNLGGDNLNGSFGTLPWSVGEGADLFKALAESNGVNTDGPYIAESYDAAALIALAMAAGGSVDRASIAANILNVANAPGEVILPGQLAKGLEILAAGGQIDYQGATNVELIGPGEAAGTYREFEVADGEYETINIH